MGKTGEATKRPGTYISEVILENFMSYEYAKIPLKRGLNLITGPNGAGKSSILLGISVALGQAHTERAKKLSGLIRHGKEAARVTLIFDNSPKDGTRPIPYSRSDTFLLSRYIRRDGSYWYEADYRSISKGEVVELFRGMGLNPDNLLIIMHQGMIEEFSIISPQERLRMMEEAVGFSRYREDLLEARRRLQALLSEEESLRQLLKNAENTLEYWRMMYERFLLKKELVEKKSRLEREYAWAKVAKQEANLKGLEERLGVKRRLLGELNEKLATNERELEGARRLLEGKRMEVRRLYFLLMKLERDRGKDDGVARIVKELEEALEPLYGRAEGYVREGIEYQLARLRERREEAERRSRELGEEMEALLGEVGGREGEVELSVKKIIQLGVEGGILAHRRRELEREIGELERGMKEGEEELRGLLREAEGLGPRISTDRSPSEVMEELKLVTGHLLSVGDIPEEAERIYTDYSNTLDELRARLQVVLDNKREVLKELEERRAIWKGALQSLLEEVNRSYGALLRAVEATGYARLVEGEDIERSGLELYVGFRGTEPLLLDAYTQSGGERSVATIAFLLALQQRVVSPFRALDEFDLHLDPRNREAILRMLLQMGKGMEGQYIVITPSQLAIVEEDVNIIFVQKSYGRSQPRRVEIAAPPKG